MKRIIFVLTFMMFGILSYAQDISSQDSLQRQAEFISKTAKKFNKSTNEFDGNTWYTPKTGLFGMTHYLYFQHKDGIYTNLRLHSTCITHDWVFVNKMTFKINGKFYSIDVSKTDRRVSSTKYGTYCHETIDESVSFNKELCDAIYNAIGDVIVRFEGTDGYHDQKMSEKELQLMKETVLFFKALGGKIYD